MTETYSLGEDAYTKSLVSVIVDTLFADMDLIYRNDARKYYKRDRKMLVRNRNLARYQAAMYIIHATKYNTNGH